MQELIFKDWKCRCSSLGHILTNRPEFTKDQKLELKALEKEKKTGLNQNGNKTKWTDAKQKKLKSLIAKRDEPDTLSSGIITHLDNVFRAKFWNRSRLLYNKYLDKGNLSEEDSLDLLSKQDGYFYAKNEQYFENDYICGTPDNIQFSVKDTKTNYDKESFDNAELTALYRDQVKGYIWLTLKELKNWKGELVYVLVNNPVHQLLNEKTSLFYKLGQPDDDDIRFIEAIEQSERNMIFDINRFIKNYPHYNFQTKEWKYDIPSHMRLKRFEIALSTKDIKFIKQRVLMCREYLINKEIEERKLINA